MIFRKMKRKCHEEFIPFRNLPKSPMWAGSEPGDSIKVYLDAFMLRTDLVTQVTSHFVEGAKDYKIYFYLSI